MEDLPPEPTPREQPFQLDYASPRKPGPTITSVVTRTLTLLASVIGILLAGFFAMGGFEISLESHRQYGDWSSLPDGLKLLLASVIVLVSGIVGIKLSFKSNGNDPRTKF